MFIDFFLTLKKHKVPCSLRELLDLIALLKTGVVFGLVCSWIAVFQGYDSEPTSEGISIATTKTVVYSSLSVLGLDFLLTAVMFG